jgi:hypothetical protein
LSPHKLGNVEFIFVRSDFKPGGIFAETNQLSCNASHQDEGSLGTQFRPPAGDALNLPEDCDVSGLVVNLKNIRPIAIRHRKSLVI